MQFVYAPVQSEVGPEAAVPQKESQLDAEKGRQRRHEEVLDGQRHDFVELQSDTAVEDHRHVDPHQRQDRQKRPHGGGGGEAVDRALRAAGVAALADRRIGTLSGGEKRKAFLARALAQESGILLLDEPEAALDAAARNELLRTLRELRRERDLTVIMAVHDLDFGLGAADAVCGLKHGELRFFAPPEAAVAPERLRELYGIGCRVFRDETGRLRAVPEYQA